jgi:ABC-type Zn uptake system ZnuABC Zn-binding protein ZnuA
MTYVAIFGLILTAILASPGDAVADRIRTVASLPDLKALAEEVGGDLIDVDVLARGAQNAHDIEVRPSLMAKLRRADVMITNGLELDFWAEPLIQGSGNPRLLLGGPGRIDASRSVPILEVPAGRVDRSMGDVHPQGNPHYTLDPLNAALITANIVEGLARVGPEQRAKFEQRRQQFLDRLTAAVGRWSRTMEPFQGVPVIVNHNSWIYFLTRFGLRQAGTIEDRPGIPPSPAHLGRLIQHMKQHDIKIVILEPWGDRKIAERVANEAGAKVVLLAHAVGSVKGIDTYLHLFERNIDALTAAFRESRPRP